MELSDLLLRKILASLEDQSLQGIAQDDPGNWAKQALARVHEWVGVQSSDGEAHTVDGTLNGDWRRSRYSRAFTAGARKLAEEWDGRLMETAFRIMESPGCRIAAAGLL